jgi:23S rRNA U2552 (ribose-2'-O)-methylase RlmE/FtsJ
MNVTMKHLHADTYGVWIIDHPSCAQGKDRRVAFVRDVPKSACIFIPQHFLSEDEQAYVVEAVKAWHASDEERAKSFANPENKS